VGLSADVGSALMDARDDMLAGLRSQQKRTPGGRPRASSASNKHGGVRAAALAVHATAALWGGVERWPRCGAAYIMSALPFQRLSRFASGRNNKVTGVDAFAALRRPPRT
jgi:hypothetical protein